MIIIICCSEFFISVNNFFSIVFGCGNVCKNAFKTKEKQKLTEIKKLAATDTLLTALYLKMLMK